MEKLPKKELLKRVGVLSQVAGVRNIEFASGRAKGTQALEVYNLAGLRFTVLPDKCMDIADLSWKGMNLGFSSKNGCCTPADSRMPGKPARTKACA